MDIGGFPVTILDTAGIRISSDPIEVEGIAMAKERYSFSALVIEGAYWSFL